MTKNILTIIIPTKNENETLLELLNCLDRQTFNDFNIIVADNSDSNQVKHICDQKNIYLIKGGLPGKARNNGVLHTSSEYIMFIDADINIKDTFIEQAIEKIRKKNADCLSFGFFPRTSNLFLKVLHWIAKYYFFITTKVGMAHGIGGTILIRRLVHETISGFDETITVAEDHNYLKRVSVNYKYSFLLTPSVALNTRRFIKYGILSMGIKYFLIEMYRIFIGEIRHNKIPYFENNASRNTASNDIYFENNSLVKELK